MAIDELYLDNLDEFVNEENKVVTYKWLSRSIGVHVNQAKQMLHTFVLQQRNQKNNDSLSVTYLLAGTLKDDVASGVLHKVCILPEEQLEATKSRMLQVSSCHVYSVQKSQLKDSNSLYTVDYDLLHEHILASNRHSAITCTAAKMRTDAELEGLRRRGGEAYAPSYKAKAATTNGQAKKHQSGAIGAMFNKAAKKEPVKSTEKKPQDKPLEDNVSAQPKETKTTQKETKKGGGIASMFAKQAARPKPEPKKVEEDDIVDVDVGEEIKKPSPEPQKNKAIKTKKDSNEHAKESGKQNKRRRIKQMEVSSSSEDEIDEIPPTPPREPTPEPSPVPSPEQSPTKPAEEPEKTSEEKQAQDNKTQPPSSQRRRKRRRKHVDKTFIDDDGFMVTEKVWESESTDASDFDEPKAKKAPASKPKEQPKAQAEQKTAKKKTSPNKATGKQTSLMNFFKKK